MSLKLFHATESPSSFLSPGETTVAVHPGWLVLAISAWIGFACNVALWRALTGDVAGAGGWPQAMLMGLLAGSATGVVLSLLGWRRTFKPAASLLLLLAAAMACGLWLQATPVDLRLLQGRALHVVSGWPALLSWKAATLLCLLGLLPMIWLWRTPMRRLPGPAQLSVNTRGMVASALLLGASAFALAAGLAAK